MAASKIHPTALVDKAAEVADDVTIGPYTCIASDVKIGPGSAIGPHVVIHSHTTLGAGCKVHAGAVLGDLPQDLAFSMCESFVEIGSECVIREGVTIHRGTKPGTKTIVGDGCYLMALSHLAHNVEMGQQVIVVNGAMMAGYVKVGDGAFISGHAIIHQFTRIGRLVMLSGGAGVGKDVPPFCTVHGVALNQVAGLNVVGMRRAGIPPEERVQIKRAFTMLYRSGLNFRDAARKIRDEFDSGPALEIAEFVEGSERGICAMKRGAEPGSEE